MTELQDFFQRKNIPIKNTLDDDCDLKEYMDNFDPHIIFPCQPYNQLHGNILDFEHNKHRIYCYIPYGISIIKDDLTYNLEFHNLCWRFYLANNLHYQTALELMANKAINVKIVGEPDYDKFISESIDPWKKITDGKKRKRVIWSPHFSIQPNEYLHHSSFLWLFDEMIKIAKEYQDKIQIAFKPHPHLYSVLCSLDNWGENKAKEYYRIWAEMKNTQLEEGDYIGLFKFSDAMIHDCSSFTGEYLFVNKPVLFTSKNIKSIRDESNDFALKCLDLHYIGQSIEDIHFFIDNIVLHNHDTLKSDREIFYNDYLIPPGNKKVAENIFNDLYESFELVNH
ncbi:MAG: CDP-glycerol glycerophosphotransferase family protein [Bacilli bacterium]|nr:CDP-glycerol glycerophosphotransferase family protein [Bacilli bacterium]